MACSHFANSVNLAGRTRTAGSFSLEAAVRPARLCAFAAFRQGATMSQAISCEPDQRHQGAAKTCNRFSNGLIHMMNTNDVAIFKHFESLLIVTSD